MNKTLLVLLIAGVILVNARPSHLGDNNQVNQARFACFLFSKLSDPTSPQILTNFPIPLFLHYHTNKLT